MCGIFYSSWQESGLCGEVVKQMEIHSNRKRKEGITRRTFCLLHGMQGLWIEWSLCRELKWNCCLSSWSANSGWAPLSQLAMWAPCRVSWASDLTSLSLLDDKVGLCSALDHIQLHSIYIYWLHWIPYPHMYKSYNVFKNKVTFILASHNIKTT